MVRTKHSQSYFFRNIYPLLSSYRRCSVTAAGNLSNEISLGRDVSRALRLLESSNKVDENGSETL